MIRTRKMVMTGRPLCWYFRYTRSLYVIPVLTSCLNVLRPMLPAFWTSLVPRASPLTRIFLGVLQLYVGLLQSDGVVLYTLALYPFLFSTLDLLGILR